MMEVPFFVHPMAIRRSKPRAVREMFRKRSKSLVKKIKELSEKTGAKVQILVEQNEKIYEFKTRGWTPSEQDMVSHS